MRPRHEPHLLPAFPVYSAAFISTNQLVLGGGGGASYSGIKNKLRLYDVNEKLAIELKDEFELERGEDAPMSMAADLDSTSVVCGVNSVLEKLEKGENENCRAFSVADMKMNLLATQGTLTGGDVEDYQKVTVLSPDGSVVAVAGSHDFSLLSYPSLIPISESVHTEKEIYDVTISTNQIVVATTHNLLVYTLPGVTTTSSSSLASSPNKSKKKSKIGIEKLSLKLEHTVDLPSLTGEGSTFRAARFHPLDPEVLYTIINTTPPRSKNSRGSSRQAFVAKWKTQSWTIEKSRKVSDRGITCADMSPDGRFLGYGSSDLSIGMLDSKTLSPLVTILKAHEFPPTTIKFNTLTTLLVSGSADNSIRVVSIPSVIGGSSWTLILLFLLTILVLLLAIGAKQNFGIDGLKW